MWGGCGAKVGVKIVGGVLKMMGGVLKMWAEF